MAEIGLKRFYKREFLIGFLLMVLGVFMPLLLTVESLNIYGSAMEAIRTENSVPLLVASLKLVALNSIRCLPHYLGAFIMVDSFSFTRNNRRVLVLKSLLVVFFIPIVYRLIWMLFGIHYDFGVPALVLIALIALLGRADYTMVHLLKKLLMVSVFIISAQFLDIMPGFPSLAAGRGDMSKEIKYVARFLDAESVVQSMALLFFSLFMLTGILLLMLVRGENNLRTVNELKKQNEQIQMENRLHDLENRTSAEMKNLVHDLKSPLTSAQALVSLVKLSSIARQDTQNILYLEKVESSIERMSDMISEILHENHLTVLTVKELLGAVLSQVSVTGYAAMVQLQDNAPDCHICVNKIRFVRALVNLMENSFHAIDSANGQIVLRAERQTFGSDRIVFLTVQDNGCGIAPEHLDSIWESGFSSRSSHGLGLSFAKQVVTTSDGDIQITSTQGHGTTVVITLPEGD